MILRFNSGSSISSLNASQVAALNFSIFPTGNIEKRQNTWRVWQREVWGPQIARNAMKVYLIPLSLKDF